MNLKKIWEWILEKISFLKKEAQDVLVISDKIVDALKKFDGSPAGQFVEAIAKQHLPANLVNAFILYLPQLFVALNWAKKTATKTDEQLLQEGLKYLKNTTDKNVKATNLAALNAHITMFKASNEGVTDLTIQRAIIANQAVHDPGVLPTNN